MNAEHEPQVDAEVQVTCLPCFCDGAHSIACHGQLVVMITGLLCGPIVNLALWSDVRHDHL